MKIKLDENLPASLVPFLQGLGHEVDTVPQEGLAGQDDDTVWKAAQRSGRFFITQDLDFSDIRKFLPGTHHGLLLVRLRDADRKALTAHIRILFRTEDVETWTRSFVIATERKIRVRRPS